MNNDGQIQRLIGICKNSSFLHRAEIVEGVESGQFILQPRSGSLVSAKQLIDIYRGRAERLANYKSEHSERLRNEILEFLAELEKAPNEKVTIWHVSKNASSDFVLFEGIESQKILGCLLATDRRKVSEQEWRKLWNENIEF